MKEADNWTTLTTEIEDVFDGSSNSSDGDRSRSGDIDLVLATTKLTGIQASLKILTHVPDYEDRVSKDVNIVLTQWADAGNILP